MRLGKAALWVSVGTLVVSILAVVPGYLIFFDKPELAYQTLVEKIPLPQDLAGRLPDTLAIVIVQNLGRQPSLDVEGNVTVPGQLIESQVQGPNPAYGQVSTSRNGSQVSFNCPRLAPGDYQIKLSIWYRGEESPDIGVADSRGAAREVSSIAAQTARSSGPVATVFALAVGLLGSFVAVGSEFFAGRLRKSISRAAREVANESATITATYDGAAATQTEDRADQP